MAHNCEEKYILLRCAKEKKKTFLLSFANLNISKLLEVKLEKAPKPGEQGERKMTLALSKNSRQATVTVTKQNFSIGNSNKFINMTDKQGKYKTSRERGREATCSSKKKTNYNCCATNWGTGVGATIAFWYP